MSFGSPVMFSPKMTLGLRRFSTKLNEHIEEAKAEEGFESYDIGEESYDIIERLDILITQIGGYGHFTQGRSTHVR